MRNDINHASRIQIVKEVAANVPLPEVARKYGVSNMFIRNICDRAIKGEPLGDGKKPNKYCLALQSVDLDSLK